VSGGKGNVLLDDAGESPGGGQGAEVTKKLSTDIGTKVTGKWNGRTGTVVDRSLSVPSVAHPGIWGKTVVTVRFNDGGFDATGDRGWFRSNFRTGGTS
jgi:hypothetical protein